MLWARRAADGDRCEFVFGADCGGAVSVSAGSWRRRSGGLEELAAEARQVIHREPCSLEELAVGLLRIADANMAAAIRSVTVAKGADPADYVLVAFGGAAPQHACAVARELGIRKVLNHPEAGVLSALGIGLADVVRHRSCGIERPLDEESLEFACEAARRNGAGGGGRGSRRGGRAASLATRSLDVRYQGVESCSHDSLAGRR